LKSNALTGNNRPLIHSAIAVSRNKTLEPRPMSLDPAFFTRKKQQVCSR